MTRTLLTATSVLTAVLFTLVGHAQSGGPQPTIASISGSIAQGSMLTINGSNLHAETRQGWDSRFLQFPNAWSFEGGSPLADGFRTGGPAGYDSNVKLLGNQSMRFNSAITNPQCTTGIGQSYANFAVSDPANQREIWTRTYIRYNRRSADWPNNYIKMLEPLGSNFLFQPDPRGLAANRNPTSWYMDIGPTGIYNPNPSGEIQNHRWYAIELHVKASPPLYEAWIDGTKINSLSPQQSGVWNLYLFGVINACGTKSWDIEMWTDGLAFGSQRIYPSAIVEVGNNSNYTSATRRVQSLQSIDDDRIAFTLDTSGLGTGPFYVWVRNNAQQLSPAYFLTGGQISGPTAPSNLRIVP